MYEMNARDLGYIALSTAMLCVSAWICIPLGSLPVTMQTTAVCLIAGLLGTKRAALAVAAYLLLGTSGVPVFAGFTGGVAKLIAPTGGYIVGFFPLAILTSMGRRYEKRLPRLSFALLGAVVCYTLGTIWFVCVGGKLSVWTALTLCVLPYFPLEFAKLPLADFLSQKLKKFIKTE